MNKIIKRQQKEKSLLLEQFRRTPIIQIACEKTGVARATYYRWKIDDPQFTEAAENAIHEGISLINDMAESQLISAIRDKNFSAIAYWLNHRHPAYTNRVEITTGQKPNEPLSKEQEELIQKALQLAGLPGLQQDTESEQNHENK